MRDTDEALAQALADIVAIRSQIARETPFRGFGSVTVAATGVLAAGVAGAQALWLGSAPADPIMFFVPWVAAAFLAFAMIGVEAVRRSRRLHSGLADAMVWNAIEVFLPAAGSGACLALVIARFAPGEMWMLPGLWQVLVGLGLFASARILPRAVQGVGAWYLLAGLAGFALTAEARALTMLSPWAMGLPFLVGQTWLAVILHRAAGGGDGDL